MMVGTIISLIYVAAVIIVAVKGYIDGAMHDLFLISSIIVSFIAIPVIYPLLYLILSHTPIYNIVYDGIDLFARNLMMNHKPEDLPIILNTSIDKGIIAASGQSSIYLTRLVMRVFTYLLGFVIITATMKFIFHTEVLVEKIPFIKKGNKIVGCIGGVVKVLGITWVLMALLAIMSTIPLLNNVVPIVLSVPIFNVMYQINPLLLLI